MRFAQAFQPNGRNALGEPKESSLHVGWEGRDLCSDSFVEDFDPPSHALLYLIFEIKKERAKPYFRMPHDRAHANLRTQHAGRVHLLDGNER